MSFTEHQASLTLAISLLQTLDTDKLLISSVKVKYSCQQVRM